MVSLRLLSLVKEECLLFNPNLRASGLKCAMSPHGLVLVAVAGTVHRDNTCLGIFEQIFGLISCPIRENTWKIKVVNLKIVGQNALEPGMQLQEPSIKYEPNQLQELYDGEDLTVWTWEVLGNDFTTDLTRWGGEHIALVVHRWILTWLQPCDVVSFLSQICWMTNWDTEFKVFTRVMLLGAFPRANQYFSVLL